MKHSSIDTSAYDSTGNALIWTLMSIFLLLAAVNGAIAVAST